MRGKLLDRLMRSRSSISWPVRLAAIVGFWLAGHYSGWGMVDWLKHGSESWLLKRVGSGAVFLFVALLLDLWLLPDGKSSETVDAEGQPRREGRRGTTAIPRRQRPRLRIAAWLLWGTSGFVFGVSDLWIQDASGQPGRVALAITASAILAVMAAALDAKARGEGLPALGRSKLRSRAPHG